ncbi:type IV pilus biogenesis/stability protein PilW [Colwellia sp. MEBiC06753]
MVKALKLIALSVSVASLSACVTQNYENSNTPVIQNDTSNTEIAMTRISLGLGYLKMGNTTQAKLNLEKAKRFSPNLVQVYTAFAHYYETVGEDELTIASYEKALSLKPDDADTLNNYGVFLCRKDKLPEAEKQFLKAIAVPSYLLVSQSYENLALCQLKAPNFEKAQTYLEKAIDHNPSSAPTLYQMMRLQYAQSNYQQALAYSKRFEKATRRFTPESLALSFKINQKLDNRKIAKNYGTMLVNMFPESWQAKQYLLNDLAEIEADELAEKYQLLKFSASTGHVAKKVVVLSDQDKPALAINRRKNSINTDSSQSAQLKTEQEAAITADENQATVTKAQKKTVVLKAPPLTVAPIENNEGREDSTLQVDEFSETTVANETKANEQLSTETVKTTSNELSELEVSQQSVEEFATEMAEESEDANLDTVAETTDAAEQLVSELTEQESNVSKVDEFGYASIAGDNSLEINSADDDNTNEHMLKNDGDNTELNSPETLVAENSEAQSIAKDIAEDTYLSLDELPQHKVVAGENLFTISKRYNIHLRSLRKWNGLDERALIKIGDTVYLADPSVVQQIEE